MLELNSDKYLKRLTRELNKTGSVNGFYWSGIRFRRAKFMKARCDEFGKILLKTIDAEKWKCSDNGVNFKFVDCYGQEVVASRV